MKPLYLDFCREHTKSVSYAGLILLLGGLLLCGYAIQTYSQYGAQKAKLQAESARLRSQQQGGKEASEGKELEPELRRAAAVIDQLSLPWEKLFNALEESVIGEDVALLSVQPDVAGGTVVLSAEAKDWNAMLSYLRHLGKGNFFTDVHLVSHQIQQSDPQKPVRFVLSCRWTSAENSAAPTP